MQAYNLSILARQKGTGENQRATGRIKAADAVSSLGTVMDISSGGMRIRRRGAVPVGVGEKFIIELLIAGISMQVPVEVRRVQKVGWRTYDLGLQFGEFTPEMRQQFGALARLAADLVQIR